MTDDTPPVLYISDDTSDLTTRYKATPRMHPGAREWVPRDAVRVKPLEWEGDGHWSSGDNEGWLEEADTPFGWGYSIEFGRYGEGTWVVDSTFGTRLTGFEDPQAAKAAAQADYAARILAALEDTGEPALIREAEARGMERAADICEGIRTRIANGPMPEGARFDYEQAIRAEAAAHRKDEEPK